MFPRLFASASLAAALLATDILLLVLFLNPDLTVSRELPALLADLFLPYALVLTGVLTLVALVGAAVRFWPRALRPRVEGLPFFTTLTALAILTAAALFWYNLFVYRYAIPLDHVRALARSAIALAVAWLVLVAVMVDALLFPLRGRGISAALVVLCYAAGIVFPIALRPGRPVAPVPVPLATERIPATRRVVLIGIDGLGPDLVRKAADEGRLPALRGLMRRGGAGPLASLRPAEGPPIWTTIFTGRFPRDHGVKGFTTYTLRSSPSVYELLPRGTFVSQLEKWRLVKTQPVTANSRKRRALWEVLNAFGVSTGVVRFWGTEPPEHLKGFMLSNYFHLEEADPLRGPETLYPRDLWAEVRARAVQPAEVSPELLKEFVDLSVEIPGDAVSWRRELVERALAPDLSYERAGEVLRSAYGTPFYANYFYGLDVVGHTFTRFANPKRFGDVSPLEERRYGRVVERYLALLDEWIGAAARSLEPSDILVVASGYGMEPVPLWRRLLSGLEGEAPLSASHEGAPDGFLLIAGEGVRPGAATKGATILDIAPTILYLMGLPVARDMDGRVLTEILDESFAQAHPESLIPSYESLAVTPPVGPIDPDLPLLPEETP
jgi:predicted AlkP superfamily phosphohydrolase/phosphomutase